MIALLRERAFWAVPLQVEGFDLRQLAQRGESGVPWLQCLDCFELLKLLQNGNTGNGQLVVAQPDIRQLFCIGQGRHTSIYGNGGN